MINKQEYFEKGVTIINGFFSTDEIHKIKEDAKTIFKVAIKANGITILNNSEEAFNKAVFELFKKAYNDFLGAAKAVQHTFSMHRIATSYKLEGLLKDIGLVNPVICVKPIIYFNSPNLAKMEGHYKTPPHQDWRSMQGSLNSIVVWIPLVNIDKDLGAVEFIEGSHKLGLLRSESDDWFRHLHKESYDESDFKAAEVEVGDVVLFSAFTVHRSGNNITNDIRWSMHFRYNDVEEYTFVKRGMPHPYVVYRPTQEIITQAFPKKTHLKSTFQ